MLPRRCLLPILLLFTCSVALLPATGSSAGRSGREGFEQPATLRARDLLQPAILRGPAHTVDDRVKNDGLFNHYTVTTPFGTFKANSTTALYTLVREINAIAAMKRVASDKTMTEALKQSGKKTVAGLKNLFNDPGTTLEGAVSGVNSLLNRAAVTLGTRELTDSEDSRMAQFIGLSKSKGQIATRFMVNMYSRNRVLQEELDRLALADYLGGLGIGVATAVVPGVGGLILSTSGTARLLNEAINNTPASELWLQNRNRLLKLGMDGDTVELFLNNPHFSPATATVLATAMEHLQGVTDLDLLLKVALQASDPDMARTITETIVLAAGFHSNTAPLARFLPMARLFCAEKKDGALVVILPTDHVIWSAQVASVARGLTARAKKGIEIRTFGDFSARARSELERLGWQVHANALRMMLPAT